jgi:hypothetical protein
MENSQYRLHIDIPLGHDMEAAKRKAEKLVQWWFGSEGAQSDIIAYGIDRVNYRLGHDDDRQRSNYLVLTDSGHVSNKKCKIFIDTEKTTGIM